MTRYIELNQEKITQLKREAQQFQDDIVCAIGTDFMQKIAEAENRMIFDILNGLESESTADVVSKNEIVKEIFEEIEKMLKAREVVTENQRVKEFGDWIFHDYLPKQLTELRKKYMEESGNGR